MAVVIIKELIWTDKLKSINGYYLKVMPCIKKYLNNTAASMPESLRTGSTKRGKADMLCCIDDLRCSGMLISQSNKDIGDYVEFIVSVHALCHSLDKILEARELTDIREIQQLYLPLSDSVDPDIPAHVNTEYYKSKETTLYLKKLSDTCRENISRLPGYKLVTGKMKKYVRLYIEFQSCKYQPLKTRQQHQRMWSDYYIRQFPDILFWEFSASADSLLGICAMYNSASSPVLSEEGINLTDSAYMPWICAYQKMLYYYVNAREDTMTGRMNLADFYHNLKYCEERLGFLAAKALESSALLPDSGIHTALVQALPVVYLSDPRACFGLNRLASRNIMKDNSLMARSLWNYNRFLNAFK